MIIIGNNKEKIFSLQKHLTIEFEIKNFGHLKSFLDVKVV